MIQLPLDIECNNSGAELSPCREYRYGLWRIFDDSKPCVNFIMLNPSKADENANDPTIRRCIGYAKSWGYGGIYVTNLFALRATNPDELYWNTHPESAKDAPDENFKWVRKTATFCPLIIFAWGAHGTYRKQDENIRKILIGFTPYCLGKTLKGQPKHPLYLPKEKEPELY